MAYQNSLPKRWAASASTELLIADPDRVATWLICAPLVITTFLGKVSSPPFSSRGLGVGYPLLFFLFLIALFTGRANLNVGRAAYFGLMVGAFGLVQILREEPFSLTSVIFLVAVSALFILEVPRIRMGPEDAMLFAANFSAVLAIAGIVQFAAQFAIGRRLAFPLESFLPAGFLISGFHYLNPLYYGTSILKSNGIFLLEPSFFSQLMAIGLIVELSVAKRVARISLLALALLLSFSGTGVIVLLVSLPILLVAERRVDLLALLIGIVTVALVFATPLKLDLITHRINEFSDSRSSGYQRFVAWYYLAQSSLTSNGLRALFGYGAGTFRGLAAQFHSPAAEMLHSKILEEYGILGIIAYVGFLLYCILRAPIPFAVRAAVVVLQFMNGAFAEPVAGIMLTVALLSPPASSQLLRRSNTAEFAGSQRQKSST